MATGKLLNTNRINRIPLGLKAERLHHVITNNPSSANPKETLYIRIPRLTENTFFVPESVYLSADVTISGENTNYVVNNLSRNLISKLVVKWGSETILSIFNYNIYATFKDLWLTEEERDNSVFQGIQSENLRKLRSGVTVAGASDNEKALKEVFEKKYKIPLDFELLTCHSPLYKFPIQEDIIFEITLSSVEDIIVTDKIDNWNYKLENICLEYNTVTNETLARQLQNNYMSGFSIFYDWVDHFKAINIPRTETLINENINFPKRSIKGILLLFVTKPNAGQRDSEKSENPKIKNVKVTIEGFANKVFPEGMRMIDQWPEIKKHFMSEDMKKSHDCYMTMEKYYGDDNHYGLWLDLRTTEDNTLHGSGKALQNTKDGIQLAITKDGAKGPYQMHIFIVSDAQVNITNLQLASLQH